MAFNNDLYYYTLITVNSCFSEKLNVYNENAGFQIRNNFDICSQKVDES